MDATILLVDDDPMIHRLAGVFLKKAGYEVLDAASGREALNMLKQNKVSLILLDVEMPELGGMETLSLLRENHLAEGTAVCFLSGTPEQELRQLAGEGFPEAYLHKPFLPGELTALVNRLLE